MQKAIKLPFETLKRLQRHSGAFLWWSSGSGSLVSGLCIEPLKKRVVAALCAFFFLWVIFHTLPAA
jgi:hypothetical protein